MAKTRVARNKTMLAVYRPSADKMCSHPPDLSFSELTTATPVLLPWKMFTPILVFAAFSFQVRSPYGTK